MSLTLDPDRFEKIENKAFEGMERDFSHPLTVLPTAPEDTANHESRFAERIAGLIPISRCGRGIAQAPIGMHLHAFCTSQLSRRSMKSELGCTLVDRRVFESVNMSTLKSRDALLGFAINKMWR